MKNEPSSIEARMRARGDRPVLTLRYDKGDAILRYAVGASGTSPCLYSIYAEYISEEKSTSEVIPAFSKERDTAENFCAMLAHFLATPLSLHALYEDSLTP